VDILALGRGVALSAGLACAGLLSGGAMSAAATTGHGPRYSLEIAEGATTLPEYEPTNSISAGIENSKAEVFLEVIHAGLVVGQKVGENGDGARISPGPQVGDEVVFESPRGTPISKFIYDGLPTIDPTVCVGSTNFSGENTSGYVVEGFYVRKVLETPYHRPTEPFQKAFGEAQVKSLSGTTFGGNFLRPLELGEDVGAIESLKTSLPGEATYTYVSESERPVGGCPPPPAPPPPLPALQGTVLKLSKLKLHMFLHAGLLDRVTINQPGLVIQDLYLKGGTLPAHASSTKHHKHKPAALLIARGETKATAAGTVEVRLRLTSKGRRKLKHAKNAKALLITTLRSTSGAELSLTRQSVTLGS
jgi:hypothetical protein